MILIDSEERLFALNDEANLGFVWAADTKEWRPIADYVAARVWAEGSDLTPAQAAKRFPAADLGAIPAFAA